MAEYGYDIGNMTAWEDAEMTIKINTDGWTREMWEKVIGGIPIIRCKDCKHRYDENECPMYHVSYYDIDEGDGWHDTGIDVDDYSTDEGFCYKGEREEDGKT